MFDTPEAEELAKIKEPALQEKMDKMWNRAYSQMQQRTKGFDIFTKISHNQSIYNQNPGKASTYSEGSTQAIKRKIRCQVIQRVPDGEVTTQFDKNSIEQIETEFIFKNKVMRSEFEGRSMLKQLWRAFSSSYDYGFACVRTGFEKDTDGDLRTSWKQIHWNDIYPEPDCDFIEDASWYMVREFVSKGELSEIWDCETETCKDQTYNEDALRYIMVHDITSAADMKSRPFADKKKAVSPKESIEVRTLYKRGAEEFITYVPSLGCRLRTVKNYDPRKDVPLHFMVLDPDPEFPLGCSSIMWTLPQQQFADAFQTLSYDTLLLAANPPLIGYGNMTAANVKMKAGSFWKMGTNINNKIEKFPVETTTLTQYNSILEGVQARMMAGLNVADGTIASDANQSPYSKTAPGVEQQNKDKTVTVNQFQKQVEDFFSSWANHALRSYINAMHGVHKLTVDENTRRRIWDYEAEEQNPAVNDNPDETFESIIDGDKISIDFDSLSTDLLSFTVRMGSLMESEKEVQRQSIQQTIVPISQMLGSVSDENKNQFEKVLMRLIARFLEMSDIDMSQQAADDINQIMIQALKETMENVALQSEQLNQLNENQGEMINQMTQLGQHVGMEGAAPQEGQPMPEEMAGEPMEDDQPGMELEVPEDGVPVVEEPPEGAPMSPQQLMAMKQEQAAVAPEEGSMPLPEEPAGGTDLTAY